MQCEVRCGKACSVSQPCSVASLVTTSATATTKASESAAATTRLLLRRGAPGGGGEAPPDLGVASCDRSLAGGGACAGSYSCYVVLLMSHDQELFILLELLRGACQERARVSARGGGTRERSAVGRQDTEL